MAHEVVRVRFAPSPTGSPHVGNIRTALFNWLFARHYGGTFILRIEDTDVARLAPDAVEAIFDSLRWLGLEWDEGPDVGGPYAPYVQSQRLHIYRDVAERLVREGHAYYCFCSPERLEQVRKEQSSRGEPPRYDRACRELPPSEVERRMQEGLRPVIRFRMPLEGQTSFRDLLRGEIVFDNAVLDDFVLLKSDGYPTYHLAATTDDHLMRITHVMRGEEWIPSTPRHVQLYRAMGATPPQFAHLPIILGPDRTKLSKRHGATTIAAYREQGYLPDAIVNFLALLGWSKDEVTEIMSREELVRYFTLERVGKTPAVFNIEKLDWMNGVYIRKLSIDELTERVLPFLHAGLPASVPRPLCSEYVRDIVPLVQERLRKLSEAPELTEFFFVEDLEYDAALLVAKGLTAAQSLVALERARERLERVPDFTTEMLETALRALAEELKLKTAQLFGTLRVAVTGRTVAPPLFQTMAVLGRERVLRRVDAALMRLRTIATD